MSSTGRVFRVTTFGESHGTGVGCIIENVPPMMKLDVKDIQIQLDRRKPNQNSLLSSRSEPDLVEICSGVQNGVTLGTPICLVVRNVDMKPGDYKKFSDTPRPGHADLTYLSKYGVKSSSGGGRASARETVARVAAGALAEKYLKMKYGTEIVSWVNSVGDIEIPEDFRKSLLKENKLTKEQIDLVGSFHMYRLDKMIEGEDNTPMMLLLHKFTMRVFALPLDNIEEPLELTFDSIKFMPENENSKSQIIYIDNSYHYFETINVRCPHVDTTVRIINKILRVKSECDSIGGTVSCVIKNCREVWVSPALINSKLS